MHGLSSLGTIKEIRLGDTDSDTSSVSCIVFCFRYDTVSGRPSRIQTLKGPIFEQNPSIFGWDMTQNILFPFWVISQPKVDGFCSNMGHFKGWILLGRPDTVSYRKHNNEHDTEPVSLSVSSSRIFFIVPKLGSFNLPPEKKFNRYLVCCPNRLFHRLIFLFCRIFTDLRLQSRYCSSWSYFIYSTDRISRHRIKCNDCK